VAWSLALSTSINGIAGKSAGNEVFGDGSYRKARKMIAAAKSCEEAVRQQRGAGSSGTRRSPAEIIVQEAMVKWRI
jgi:hypothetical protein